LKADKLRLTKDVLHALVILTTFALLGTQNSVHYPFALMSIIGLCLVVKNLPEMFDQDSRRLFYIFALVWSPMLLSLPDAVDLKSASQTTFSYLHFLFGAYYVYWACCRQKTYRIVGIGVAALVLFALLDASFQFIYAKDIFGFPYDGAVLKGLFYPKERLGLFLAVLFPLLLHVIYGNRYKTFFYIVAFPLIVFILLLCSKRSAWLMFGLSMLGFCYLICVNNGATKKIFTMGFAAVAAFILSIAAVIYTPTFQTKATLSSGVLSGDLQKIDAASNYRLSLWTTGSSMFVANSINGIGARGYRHVYVEYADPNNFWLREGRRGQTHPHLQILEIAVETGLFGLIGFLCIYLFFVRELFQEARFSMKAIWVLAFLVAWFPLNTHLAFYGSYWSSFVWLLIPMALATPDFESLQTEGNLGEYRLKAF
jgi:O-antigen ligase